MHIARTHTTYGDDPFESVTWEKRDVALVNWRDGSVNFRQDGVEFPEDWSLNASNIVTTKYFRGAVGTPERETSLRQVVARVVDTYVASGEEVGYFDSVDDADAFHDELVWLLLHQHFAFNSPVWFNVGTSAPQQVSACQPYDALVSTESGLAKIGDLVTGNAVGTKVRTASGLAQVLAVKSNGVKDVLRLHLHSGHTLDVTADHLVWKANGRQGFVPAGRLRVKDQLSWHRTPELDTRPADPDAVAEAALAGWLLTDGFVGQYPGQTCSSLIVEPHTINTAEREWVEAALNRVWPAVNWNQISVPTQDSKVDFRRYRATGERFRPFVEKWDLLTRGTAARFPEYLHTAPLPELAAFLKSVFQADGYVTGDGIQIGLSMEAEHLMRGIQTALLRFGIFARLHPYEDARGDRHTRWTLSIKVLGDQQLFADAIGFLSEDKISKLEAGFARSGQAATDSKRVQLVRIEQLGPQEVYDIQTDAEEYLSTGLRVHNCFILSVQDDMDSILNWYREEGLIFKGGSGSGVNLSSIRSSRELLSSGGTASGPVSFMRGADASAGTIKSGGATRRAAKMVVLDVDHPDIREFISAKAREEDKIRVLRDAGYDMDLGGADAFSVQYQNANNSIRVSDDFMQAVEADGDFDLTARLDGRVIETVRARTLWDEFNAAAWACADPGIQYDGPIQAWHTTPQAGRISASNPCSEYVHLDNSSCNLASLNLLKYLRPGGSFDDETFAADVRVIFTAMDISICFADFPTEAIGETTRNFRQLGIGYANLGALLMSTGHGYDSPGGRALAAAVTSLLTAVSYRTSAELAATVGPYAGYAANQDDHLRVIQQHSAAAGSLAAALRSPDVTFVHPGLVEPLPDSDAARLAQSAHEHWFLGYEQGSVTGYRNAQASLLAPTGTIGFMMDCDTTGGEPDFSLVKTKKLVGGGSMDVINQSVPRALQHLGYDVRAQQTIEAFIAEHGHVVGAPGLVERHYEVFDCAVGQRAIAPMGHVTMMAAQQPFLSGAISKTVNLPESATVEDLSSVHYAGWKLGLKALAVYRDNCKVGQPLSVKEAAPAALSEPVPESGVVAVKPVRRKLPRARQAVTTSFHVGGAEGYLTTGAYEDGALGEVFVKVSKQGSTLAGIMDAFSIAVSIGLQYGVPLEVLVEKFRGSRFEPAGMTNDPDLRLADSLIDYLFKRLAVDHLTFDQREGLGIYTMAERTRQQETGSYAEVEHELETHRTTIETGEPVAAPEPVEVAAPAPVVPHDPNAPFCARCGDVMRRAGSCYACESCGDTSGCS